MNILASPYVMHIWVNNAIVETLRFLPSQSCGLRKYTSLVKCSYSEYLNELMRDKQFTLTFQENRLRCFESPQATQIKHVTNATTKHCIAPPPKKRHRTDTTRLLARKNTKKHREIEANLRVKRWLLRYLHEINRLANPRLSLVTLQQILKPNDPCGLHHRERILKYVPQIYKSQKRERLLKVTAELLDQLHKDISENLEDLGGAA